MTPVAGAMALTLWAGTALAADPVEAVWKTKPDDNGNFGHVEIKPCGPACCGPAFLGPAFCGLTFCGPAFCGPAFCGPAFCGTLIGSFDGTGAVLDSENVGKQIVWDMMAAESGYHDGGKVWAPDRDKTFGATMQVTGSTLAVSGCVPGGLICRASDWSRLQ